MTAQSPRDITATDRTLEGIPRRIYHTRFNRALTSRREARTTPFPLRTASLAAFTRAVTRLRPCTASSHASGEAWGSGADFLGSLAAEVVGDVAGDVAGWDRLPEAEEWKEARWMPAARSRKNSREIVPAGVSETEIVRLQAEVRFVEKTIPWGWGRLTRRNVDPMAGVHVDSVSSDFVWAGVRAAWGWACEEGMGEPE